MIKFRNLISLLLIISLGATLLSCGNNSNKEEKEKIKILYSNYLGAIAFTNLSKLALEKQGYDVEITNLDLGLIFGELSKDDPNGDVFMDAWLPNTHEAYWEEYGDKLVTIGESFSEGTTGLVVPTYVPINSIEELNENKDKFKGEIIGVGSGAGIHRDTYRAIDEYNLELEQITSSGPAMVAAIKKATKNKKWIVVTGWKPHLKWLEYDLKYLEDPKGVYPKDVCAIVSRRGFKEDMPEATTYFENFNLTDDQLNILMDYVEKVGPLEGARKWYEENEELVDSWYQH